MTSNSGPTTTIDEYGEPSFRVKEISQCASINPQIVLPLQTENNFLLIGEQGQVFHNKNGLVQPLADFGSPVQMTFCNGSVVLISQNGLAFRFVVNDRVPLRDLAATHATNGENLCFVEISREEAKTWSTKLQNSDLYPNLNLFKQKCEQRLEESMNDDEFLVVEVEYVQCLIKDLSDLVQHYNEMQTFDEPLILYGSLLLDKLRLFNEPYAPYSNPNPPSLPEADVSDLGQLNVMNSEAARLLTFYKWRRDPVEGARDMNDCLYATPKSLAAAGFFHRPSSKNLDRVACFTCNVCLVNWEPQDDPIQEHSKHGQMCRFIQKTDLSNIPYMATLSHLPLYKWSSICEKPDLQLNAQELILSYVNTETSWFAVAIPCNSNVAQNKPSIFLFDTSKIASKPIEILLDLYATTMVDKMGLMSESTASLEPKRSFDWLNSVEDKSAGKEPLCQVKAMCTSTSFEECTVTLRGERIVGVLCTGVAIDENRMKSMQNHEEIIDLIESNSPPTTNTESAKSSNVTTKRRPFILVHHIVEFPDDNNIMAVEYVNAWNRAWMTTSNQNNKFESFYPSPNWPNNAPSANESPIDALVLYDDKGDTYAEITKESSKDANEDVFYNPMSTAVDKPPDPDHVPIYYHQTKPAAIGIQCIRLPHEFDSADYQIDCIVSSASGNLIAAAINQQSEVEQDGVSSALVIYSWLTMLHMLQELPVAIIPFRNGKNIKSVHLLGKDYFGSANIKRSENTVSTEALNDTACVLFDDGSLQLVDLDFGRSVKIDIGAVKSVSVNSVGEICALTQDNKLVNVEVEHSIPSLNRDLSEELVISLLSIIESTTTTNETEESLAKRLLQLVDGTQKASIVESALKGTQVWNQTSSFGIEQLAWIWNLIKTDPLVRSHAASAPLPTSPLFNSRSHSSLSQQAQLQSNLGLTVQMPHTFVEFNVHNTREHNPLNLTILTTATCQQFCVLNKHPYSDLLGLNVDAVRTWQIKPRRESTKKSYVFEMSLMFGLNLSHVNLTLGLAGFVRGVSDIRVSIYLPKTPRTSVNDEMADLFGSLDQAAMAGPSNGFTTDNYLELLSAKAHLLEQKFERCFGPFDINEFADINGKQVTIQLSVCQLLMAAARVHSKAKEANYNEGWMFKTFRYYVHVEVNERRTIQQKAYNAALQNSQTDQNRSEVFHSVGGSKRTRAMDTASGGFVPLPFKTATERKKQQFMKNRNGSSRKRFVHVSNLVAESVAQSALKQYTSSENKAETVLSCLEFLTISAHKATDSRPRANMERCLMALDSQIHIDLLKMAAGIIPEAPKDLPYYRVLIAQQQALDLLIWLLTQWRTTRSRKRIETIANAAEEILPDLIHNCFVVAPRSVARKMNIVLAELLELIYQKNNNLATKILEQCTTVFTTKRFRFSASLQWLTTLARMIVKNACLQRRNAAQTTDQLMQAVVNLNKTCNQIVQTAGKVLRTGRSNSFQNSSGICVDSLDEIRLYDAPALLAILVVDPSLIAAAQNNARLAFSTFKNATSNFTLKNDGEQPSNDSMGAVTRSFFENGIQFEPASGQSGSKSRSFGSKSSNSNAQPIEQTKDSSWLNDSTALATVYLLDDLNENEVKWHEHLGINTLETPVYPTKKILTERANNPLNANGRPQTAHGTQSTSQQTTESSNSTQSMADLFLKNQGRVLFDELCSRLGSQNVHRYLIGSEQIPGLNEVERLCFTVLSASCQLKILDLNASTSSQIPAEASQMDKSVSGQSYFGFPSSVSTTKNITSLPTELSNFSFSQDINKRAFVPAQSKNLQSGSTPETRDNQLKSAAEIYLLERQRAIYEKNQADKSILPPPLTSSFVAFAPTSDESQQLHSDSKISSAFLSFDEMESDDLFGTQMDVTEDNTLTNAIGIIENSEKKSLGDSGIRRPPVFLMEMDGCQSGQLIQVVLDFEVPFLLTDLIVPSNELFSAVAIDTWLQDEKHSTIRVAYSTEIENRSLVLNDLTASQLIRYVRVSFTTRDSRRSSTIFMIGQFFGTRFFSPWQLYGMAGVFEAQTDEATSSQLKDPFADVLRFALDQQKMNFKELDASITKLFTRYQSNVCQLKKALKQPGLVNVQRLYQKCLSDRQMYNYLISITNRSQLDMHPALAVLNQNDQMNQSSMAQDWFGKEKPLDLGTKSSWRDATPSELRFVSIEFMSLANEVHYFLGLSQQAAQKAETGTGLIRSIDYKLPDINTLDLETAVRLFGYFVCGTNDRLQATCCGFLFHQGSKTSWWQDFFPAVIRRHFVAGSGDSLENIFILLAYICNQSVRYHEAHTPIVEKLVSYLYELISSPKTANASIDTTQLSWLLLLLSSAFDIIVPNTKHTDRWSFISGQSCASYPQAPVPNENFRRYSRKIGSANMMKDQFWSSHYHNSSGFSPSSSSMIYPYSESNSFLPPMPLPSYQKYSSYAMNPDVDHATIIEMKKIGSELRHIGKQLDIMLSSNQLSGDDYTPLKKGQKNIYSLYNTAHAYITRSPAGIHESFVDKVLITGLEKADLENMKAPLATQEEDFLLNADENDSTAKKQQHLEAVNANIIRTKLIKVKRMLYSLVKQAKNASRNKNNTSSQTRSRRFAIRLQLPQQLVVQTIRVLMRLVADNNSILSDSTQILLFKVCAKLSVHGCRQPIAFHQIVESAHVAKNLMAVVIENSVYNNEWNLHAMTNFLLDVCEAENPGASSIEPCTSPSMEFAAFDEPDQGPSKERQKAELISLKFIDASSSSNAPKDTNGNVEDIPMEVETLGAEEATKKRRKETPTDGEASSSATLTNNVAPNNEKDSSPMEEEICSASTSTFMTNVDDDETFTKNNLAIVSPTLTTSGLINEQTLVTAMDLSALSEGREIHLGLMDERTEIGNNPRYPFSFPLFDRASESDVDLLILMALFALRPIEKTNPAYWDNCRGWFLRQIGFAVARARYERGQALSEIFRWFDYVLGAELEAANNCKTENAYIKWALLSIINSKDFIEREFDLNGKITSPNEKSPSHSALACATYFSQYYYIHDGTSNNDMDEDPIFDALDDQFNDVFSKLLASARGGNESVESFAGSLRSIVERRRASENPADLPDEDSELNKLCEKAENYLAIDASEDTAQLVAVRGFMPLHKAIFVFTKLRFIQSFVQVIRCVKNLAFAHLPDLSEIEASNKKESEKSRRRKSMTKNRHPESPSDSSSTEKPKHADNGLDDRINYNITINVNFLNSRASPLNLGFEHSPNMGIRIQNVQRRLIVERLVSTCHFLNKMSLQLQRTIKTSTVYDTRGILGTSTCASLIIDGINRLLTELNVEKANEMSARTHRCGSGQFLTNLLNFYWEFQTTTGIANNTQITDPANQSQLFVLNEKAIGNLMKFAVEYDQMNEQIWLHLLKILNSLDASLEGQDCGKETKNYKFTQWVENSPFFARFVERFLQFSMGRFSMVSSTRPSLGPAIQNIFSRFVTIMFKQITGKVMDDVLQVLTKIIRNSRGNGYINFPAEMIFTVTLAIDKLDRTCACTPSIAAEFLYVLMEFTSDFFIETNRIQRHVPDEPAQQTIFTTESQPIANNVCFSTVLSAASMNERTMTLHERLRIQHPGNSTKNSKNIIFSKRTDLLENTLRDNEVATKDLFTMILYSLLRFSVRLVSQYKPKVVKAVLQEHPKTLNRAVDMLFTFVPCTSNNVDEITVENFKIVTLSDAVIHLLLVISETVVEEPESCRLFIRLIINMLQDRITLNTSTDQPESMEQSMENNTALMDLPLPVLLLLKSLLGSITRCQMFVDEGGHIFVADQLQRSLDSVAHDWNANNQFPNINRHLNALASNITGVEPMNPLLNTIPPSQIQPSTSGMQSNINQSANASSSIIASSAFQTPLPEPVNTLPSFALNYPTVSIQPPNVSNTNPTASFTPANAPFSMQILNIKATCLQPNDTPDADDLYNFAPVASFRSDLISPAQLAVLNQSPDLNTKRNRATTTFSYRFPSRKTWFDLTMVLPYKIVLHEIIIRGPDSNSIANAPSAVQVELSSDPAQASWSVLSCPVTSDSNPNYYRISTSSYKYPVTGVRIHFGCPKSTLNMHLTQLQLLGSTSIRSMRLIGGSKAMFESQLIYHWVALFSRLCKRIDVPVWNFAPKLSESLLKVYLGEDHNKEVLRQVYDLLSQLDQKSKNNCSLVSLMAKYLLDGKHICSKAYSSAAELLYATCISTSSNSIILQRFNTEKQPSRPKEIVILRQRELLVGIQQLINEQSKNQALDEEQSMNATYAREISIFLWAASCVIWHNFTDINIRYDTIALCLEIGPSIIPNLAQFVLNSSEKILYKASCWFLTTLGRTSPELLTQIFECLELNKRPVEDYPISSMRILGKVCQSIPGANYLIKNNILSSWITTVIEITREQQHIRIEELTAIVNCFKELAVIDVVASYFETYEKSELLFRSLIRYVTTSSNNGQRNDQSSFTDAVISFIQRCMSCTTQRERIAGIVAQILKSYLGEQKGGMLPKSFEELISRLIVADNTITVRLTGVTSSNNNSNQIYNFEDQMKHPLFGCMQDDRVMKVPLSTQCKELLPHIKKVPPPPMYKAKKDYYEEYPTSAQLKMVLGPEELDDKEILPAREVYPDSQKTNNEYPYMYKQFAIQLTCGAISTKHALNNEWTIETVLNGLKAVRQAKDIEMDVEPQNSSHLSHIVEREQDFNDGYFTLTLKVKGSLPTSMMMLAEEVQSMKPYLQNIQPTPSTLFYFAKFDGLKSLAGAVNILQHVDLKLKMLQKLINPLPDQAYRQVKAEIQGARKSISDSTLRKVHDHNLSGQSSQQITDAYRLLYETLQQPSINVYNASRILSTRGLQFPESENSSKQVIQQPKPTTSNAAMAFAPYDTFDSIDGGLSTDGGDDTLTMIDFLLQNESAPPPKSAGIKVHSTLPKTFASTSSSSQAYGLISAMQMDDEWIGMLDSPTSFSDSLKLMGNGSADPSSSMEQVYNQLTAQIQSQFADLATKLQAIPGPKDGATCVVKLPLVPLKRARSSSYLSRSTERIEHILVALSLFLEIDTYGETFVEYDVIAAKRLIYLLMGVDPPLFSTCFVAGLLPMIPQGQQVHDNSKFESKDTKRFRSRTAYQDFFSLISSPAAPTPFNKQSEFGDLTFVPFIVLSRCFENARVSMVGAEKAQKIRMQALNNGTMDVILELLSLYSNHKQQKSPMRPTGDLVVNQLINRLNIFYTDFQAIIQTFNDSKNRPATTKKTVPSFGPKPGVQISGQSSSGINPATIAFGSSASSAKKDYWAKGTGFGFGSTAPTHFNLNSHISQQKTNEEVVTYLLNIITNFIKPQLIASTYRKDADQLKIGNRLPDDEEPTPLPLIPSLIVETIKRSCLSTTLNTYLMNDSVLDISQHVSTYESVVALLLAICSSESLVQTDEKSEPVHLQDIVMNDTPGTTVYERLRQLCSCISIYITKLRKPNTSSVQHEEGLDELLKTGSMAVSLMEKYNKMRHDVNVEDEKMEEQQLHEIVLDPQGYTVGHSLDKVYEDVMRSLQYDTINFLKEDGITTLFPYHYSSNFSTITQNASSKRNKRLAQEAASLLNALPLNSSSSVFVRAADERLDTMKVLISGPNGSPYENGIFEFDVFFPNEYPNVPMQMNLMTTGNRSVRFNPNLYDDGKVCLSILNTWSGRPEERWSSQSSSFLQVLVSIQSLILVPEPFYNEPGFERTRGTASGEQSSRDYTSNIRHQNIRWAMVEHLRKPPPPFADVIRRHFWLKRDEICLQITEWIRETKEMVQKYPASKQILGHQTLMEKNFSALIAEFLKMECPPGLEHVKSKFLQDHLAKKEKDHE